MAATSACRAAAVGLLVAVLVAGCETSGAGSASVQAPESAGATASPSATPVPTPTTTPTQSPLPTPAVYGPVTAVEGIATFVSGDMGTRSTDAHGDRHARGGTFVERLDMNDPRLSGEHTVSNLAMDFWGSADETQGAIVQWGDNRIVNDAGTWVGHSYGIYSTDRGDLVVAWFKGTGAYAGLASFTVTESLDVSGGATSHYRVRGEIFPGEPPTLTLP